jgi:hypothetical protein
MDWLVWVVSDVLTWIDSPTWGTITLHVAARPVESCRSWHRALYGITQDYKLICSIVTVISFTVQVLNRLAVHISSGSR